MATKKRKPAAASKGASIDDPYTRRFRELLEEIGERVHGKKRGWQRRVGETFELYPADVTKILAGERRVGLDVATRAAAAIGLDMRYFTGTGSFDNYMSQGPRGGDRGMTQPGRMWSEIQKDGRVLARDFDRHEVAGLKRAEVLAHDVLQARAVQLAKALLDAGPGDDVRAAHRFVQTVAYETELSPEELKLWDEVLRKPAGPEPAGSGSLG